MEALGVDIAELINRRQQQILVRSCIYYELNDNVIPDSLFDRWRKELVELREKYPDKFKQAPRGDLFNGWGGTSGFDLPYRHPNIYNRAAHLLKIRDERLLDKNG